MFRLFHIGYNSVGDYQQHKIVFAVLKFTSNGYGVGDDRREIRRSIEFDGFQAIFIMDQNLVDARTVWVFRISIQGKLMGNLTVRWYSGTEAYNLMGKQN